jgi:hypothetical protein
MGGTMSTTIKRAHPDVVPKAAFINHLIPWGLSISMTILSKFGSTTLAEAFNHHHHHHP